MEDLKGYFKPYIGFGNMTNGSTFGQVIKKMIVCEYFTKFYVYCFRFLLNLINS